MAELGQKRARGHCLYRHMYCKPCLLIVSAPTLNSLCCENSAKCSELLQSAANNLWSPANLSKVLQIIFDSLQTSAKCCGHSATCCDGLRLREPLQSVWCGLRNCDPCFADACRAHDAAQACTCPSKCPCKHTQLHLSANNVGYEVHVAKGPRPGKACKR